MKRIPTTLSLAGLHQKSRDAKLFNLFTGSLVTVISVPVNLVLAEEAGKP